VLTGLQMGKCDGDRTRLDQEEMIAVSRGTSNSKNAIEFSAALQRSEKKVLGWTMRRGRRWEHSAREPAANRPFRVLHPKQLQVLRVFKCSSACSVIHHFLCLWLKLVPCKACLILSVPSHLLDGVKSFKVYR
jgi:hypothetical protein